MTDKRELFGDGPWVEEPDRVEWRSRGFVCLIVRQPELGHLCGYVGVPREHPWHGRLSRELEDTVHAHGGLNYAQPCQDLVCHVPEPGEPDHLWWLGFDCAHANDFSPMLEKRYPGYSAGGTYKDVGYVTAQVEKLARQASEAQS